MGMIYSQSGDDLLPLRDGNEMTFAGELEEMTFLRMTFSIMAKVISISMMNINSERGNSFPSWK